jgi:prophage tail gpP-like protein
MRNPDEVRLVLSGREFTGWTSAQIHMAIDTLADSFTLGGPYNPQDAALVAALEPYKYQPVKIYLGDDLYHSGRLDALSFGSDESGNTVNLGGRSLPGVLADCIVADCAQISNMTFAAIARKVAGAFGLSIRDDAALSSIIETARAEYGQTAFDFLHSLAAPHNLLLNSAYDGRLVISSGDALVRNPVRAELVEGDPLIMSLSSTFDSQRRFSSYTIATQFAASPDITGTVNDPTVTMHRPTAKAAGETDTDPRNTAARMMAEALAESLTIKAKLSGWRRPDGGLWSERQAVTLKAPSVRLLKSARYVLSDVLLSLDADSGRTTTLSLTPPELYSAALIKAGKAKADLW